MHGRTALVALLGLSLALQACAWHQLRVAEPNGYGDFHTANSNAFFWGAVEPTKVAAKCETNLIDEVRTVTSLPQALATVLTLGIWMPATVKYKCAKRPIMPDEDEGGGGGQPSGEADNGERSQDHHLR
ncbi:MAG TPA: hypothetical protein VFZ91_09710 [Allosphingosinicella sp.]